MSSESAFDPVSGKPRKTPDELDADVLTVKYEAEPTPWAFHCDDSYIRGIMGPVGSGKSSACVLDVWWRACCQQPYRGVRYTRWIVIRNTYPDLIDTTLALWKEWVPEQLYTVTMTAPIRVVLKHPLPDGTSVHAELLFIALDRPEDVRKLKSLNATGGWINEAVEIDKSVLDQLIARTDRYPPLKMGGPSYPGVIMDTNPPDDEHWWYRLAEIEKPKGYRFFRQPPALLCIPSTDKETADRWEPNRGQDPRYPPAENVRHYKSGFEYYMRQVPGKYKEWLKVYIQGQYGSVMHGKPVYPEYRDDWHVAARVLEPYGGVPLLLGWDFGLTPTVVVCQYTPQGQFRVLDEKIGQDCGIRQFVEDIARPFLRAKYPTADQYISRCDPAGSQRDQISGVTCLEILSAAGFPSEIALTNAFMPRREAVAKLLMRAVEAMPVFQLSPNCHFLRKGFRGGYRYRKLSQGFGPTHSAEPEKNIWSHPHDALQYAAMFISGTSVGGAGGSVGPSSYIKPSRDPRAGWTA